MTTHARSFGAPHFRRRATSASRDASSLTTRGIWKNKGSNYELLSAIKAAVETHVQKKNSNQLFFFWLSPCVATRKLQNSLKKKTKELMYILTLGLHGTRLNHIKNHGFLRWLYPIMPAIPFSTRCTGFEAKQRRSPFSGLPMDLTHEKFKTTSKELQE